MTGPGHEAMFGTTANPCPWWCDLPEGHGYDTRNVDGDATRIHSNSIGVVVRADLRETSVFVEAIESLFLGASGAVTRQGPVGCSVAEAEGLRPDEADRLAVLLGEAVDLIASIELRSDDQQ